MNISCSILFSIQSKGSGAWPFVPQDGLRQGRQSILTSFRPKTVFLLTTVPLLRVGLIQTNDHAPFANAPHLLATLLLFTTTYSILRNKDSLIYKLLLTQS
jgi:hypothetical protein